MQCLSEARAVRKRLDGVVCRLAWVDVQAPGPDRILADGAPTVVVPAFLARGHHVTHDVAGACRGAPGPVALTPHLGAEPEVVRALVQRLAEAGAALLVATLPRIASGEAVAAAQVDALATVCPKIRREDGRADFTRPALELVRRLRAFTPWPGLFAYRGGRRVKLLAAREAQGRMGATPGEVLAAGDEIVLACGEGALSVTALQAEGRKPLGAGAFSRGERVVAGESWA